MEFNPLTGLFLSFLYLLLLLAFAKPGQSNIEGAPDRAPAPGSEYDQEANKETRYHPQSHLIGAFDPKNDIRLLRVLPMRIGDDSSAPLKCQFLEPRSFSPQSSWPASGYSAVSYVWGPAKTSKDVETILINDERFAIRRNLFDFLLAMRETKEEGPFWIDAICIDQLNLHEKELQLTLMPKIYENAKVVLIWLGKPKDSNTIHGLGRIKACLSYKGQDIFPNATLMSPGFTFLVKNNYWTRLWIIQEVHKASRIQVYTGLLCWDFDKLENLRSWYTQLRASGDKLPESDWESWISVVESKTAWSAQKHELHEVLYLWSHCSCRDPQDRVYGLLGLVDNCELPIDLTKSRLELFQDVLQLERQRIYANGYVYADDFATKLMNNLEISRDGSAQGYKTDFLKLCMVR